MYCRLWFLNSIMIYNLEFKREDDANVSDSAIHTASHQNFNFWRSRQITGCGVIVAQAQTWMVLFGTPAVLRSQMDGNHWVIHLANSLTEKAHHATVHCWCDKNLEKPSSHDQSVPPGSGQMLEAEHIKMLPFTA